MTTLSTLELLRATVATLMLRTGETQRDLAGALGISQAHVSRKQGGRAPWTLDDCDALASHFAMPVLDLLAGPTHAAGCLPARRLAGTIGGTQTLIPTATTQPTPAPQPPAAAPAASAAPPAPVPAAPAPAASPAAGAEPAAPAVPAQLALAAEDTPDVSGGQEDQDQEQVPPLPPGWARVYRAVSSLLDDGVTLAELLPGAVEVDGIDPGAWLDRQRQDWDVLTPAQQAVMNRLDGWTPTAAPAAPAPPADTAAAPPAAAAPASAPAASPAAAPAPQPAPAADRGTRARRAPTRPAPGPAVDPRFASGPLAVLDGDGRAYCPGGLVLDCPADTLPKVVEWALGEARLGAARLHRWGKDGDPLIVLTAGAAERLGLPARLEDRDRMRLPEDHPAVKQILRAKWQLTRRGFGPWPRIYRPAQGGQRHCVQFAVVPWDALDTRAWGDAATLPAPELARILGTYATRVLTPRGASAVCGLELMTALRPPTRPVRDPATGTYTSGPVKGSLITPVDCAPPEAPPEHPAARGRAQDDVLDEEAYDWIRPPETITDTEKAMPYAVGVDVNTAFLAAASRLSVGLGEPVHHQAPQFDKRIPGSWLVDLSHVEHDPRLPSPFTPSGEPPTGPAWYATPTLAYAEELGIDVHPTEAWLRPDHGPYLDPWYERLKAAYLATMADLGVTADMPEEAFLEAMQRHKRTDPGMTAVLTAIKATVKGGIGKLKERPIGLHSIDAEGRWPALDRPTWRPDIRAAVIAKARIGMHRKIRNTAERTGQYPLGVRVDCVVYPSPGPSPLDVLPHTPDGAPMAGVFRLGVTPGLVKHEGTQTMAWALEVLGQSYNPARHVKDGHTRRTTDTTGE
jgi:BetR domain